MKATLLCTFLGVFLWAGCGQKPETPSSPVSEIKDGAEATATNVQATPAPTNTTPATPDNTNEVAILKTTEGDMVFEFWPEVAPKTVANFKRLARDNSYNGTIFHRIMQGFMIQGGDLISKDPAKEAAYGTGDPGFTVPAEFNDRKHERGVISMARLGHDINSASSQFFICLGPAPALDGSYTAFGKLIKGDDVLEKIAKTPVKYFQGEESKPTKRIEIKNVELVSRENLP